MEKVIYLAGHILNEAMVDYREKQHNEISEIEGVKPYSPHQDKSINDKSNAEQTKLAERILNNDFTAMENSDVYVLDILNEGLGTIAELGIIIGMKKQAQKRIVELKEMSEETEDENIASLIALEIENNMQVLDKPVLCYCSDIRQGHGKPYTDPDRAEFSTNQFVYGMVLEATNGEGFITWDQVKQRLSELNDKHTYKFIARKSND
ncbi:nucleoside 2-deoxyribosyltransferase [Staphylococcus haemolyticus]|uniref:nucleoside 2-deoxyribosyltransferase n=1 Tax=Staphylococcus haemolyticus TaxID=1283 RepID=UPI001F0B2E51|nr:nucleoside 2-deoxyribosyltransferase [Staphylococcus haemolyticus]MCH4501238.1 nucleoside 2-deoxyribosyltransferase domain-containing protein [Staphylococcus haemolyticus]